MRDWRNRLMRGGRSNHTPIIFSPKPPFGAVFVPFP